MASLVNWLKFAGARNSDGSAIATGTAYFYAVGSTSELLTLYSNANETATISNPVTLDASGKATVYAKVAGQVLIKNYAGATVLQADSALSPTADQVIIRNVNFYGEDAGVYGYGKNVSLNSVLTGLATSLGIDGKYKESGTATARNISDVLNTSVTPEDFGAVGDGTTDDTVALQAAINRAIAATKVLRIGPKTYKTTAALVVAASIDIQGSGKANSIIACSQEDNAMEIGIASGFFSIKDLKVTTVTTADGLCGIKVVDGFGGTFQGVYAAGRFGFDTSAVSGSRFIGCTGSGMSGTGAQVGGSAFKLGEQDSCNSCDAINVVGANTDDAGFTMGTSSVAIGCHAEASSGFSWGAVSNSLAVGCSGTGCDYTYITNGSTSCGAVFSSSTSSVAADFYHGGTNDVDYKNSWNFNVPDAQATSLTTSAAATVTFTPSPSTTGFWQIIRLTNGGNVALTIAPPAVNIPEGTEFAVVIQAAAATTATDPITWNSAYKGTTDADGEIGANTYVIKKFVSNGAGAYASVSDAHMVGVDFWS
jgi:hypothetical protein